ncbi:MAG: glycosyltransferase family 1 protein [SAR202 cluster bacterium]|nr:glycosyltransferase family 1 protein [SAR202 cluster bacterium]|tara:strand:- start:23871 stop:25097 length:1227 start_codon:yes stop_codon:yes gene_type:complete
MRIAFITVHGCPLRQAGSKDSGGMNIYILEMVKRLGARGVKVDVFTRHHDLLDPEIVTLTPGVRLVHLPAGPPSLDKNGVYELLPIFASQMRRFCIVNRLNYDLISTHYWLSGLVGMRLASEWAVPHVTSFHTMAEMKRRGRPEELEISQRDASESEIARSAASVIVWTEDEKEAVVDYCDVDSDNVSVIAPGVDLSRFRPMSQRYSRDYLGYGPEKNILFVGRLEPLKGVDNLFRAVASLENLKSITLSVVGGDGNSQEKRRLQALAKKMRLNQTVHFLGPIPQEELPIYYNAADVCVLPSYYESFGFAALEASACGKPVIASEVGGLRTIVNHGRTGFLVPPKRMDLIAERLCELLDDDLLRAQMGAAGRIRAESLGWDSSVDSLLRRFKELIPQTAESVISVVGG